MAEHTDNMLDPPDWADVETDEVIVADSTGPIDPDVVARLSGREGHELEPTPEAP